MCPPKFVILSLPRSGSTSLVNILSCHRSIKCLIEPFHPRRYGGHYFTAAVDKESLASVLDMIFVRWQGIKHVWESNGWPFLALPSLNEALTLRAGLAVIFLVRRNLLRRFVSNWICRQTQYWIGDRSEFVRRLKSISFRPIDPRFAATQISSDQRATVTRMQHLLDHNVRTLVLYYEEFFREGALTADRLLLTNQVLQFLGFPPLCLDEFTREATHWFDPEFNRWADVDVYNRIPGIHQIEQQLGCDETGWLFR